MAETRLKPKLSTRYPEPALKIKTEYVRYEHRDLIWSVHCTVAYCSAGVGLNRGKRLQYVPARLSRASSDEQGSTSLQREEFKMSTPSTPLPILFSVWNRNLFVLLLLHLETLAINWPNLRSITNKCSHINDKNTVWLFETYVQLIYTRTYFVAIEITSKVYWFGMTSIVSHCIHPQKKREAYGNMKKKFFVF